MKMGNSFSFSRIPFILFGNGKVSEILRLVMPYGRTVLLVTGKSSFFNSSAGKYLLRSLSENKISYNNIVIDSEPSPEMIDNAVASVIDNMPGVVVAIGGGSVMDAGKAISAMLTVGGNVEYYLEGVGTMDHPGSKVPFIAVPTTAGTGSEATKNAVISRTGISGYKRSLRHDNFVPDIAVVDPVLATGCPPEITAASGMDCFTQLNEAYLSDRSSLYTDALALEGLKAIRASLRKVCSDGSDLNARTEMAFAALTSGICLTNAGLGVIHGFASSIGGLYNIPHGVICGTLMALSNEITIRELRNKKNNQEAMWKYVRLGKLFIESEDKSDDFYIDGFISYLHELTEELGLPGLKQIGVNEKDMKYIVSETDNKNNPVKLNADDMEEILRRRF